jgi:hypothetical protein
MKFPRVSEMHFMCRKEFEMGLSGGGSDIWKYRNDPFFSVVLVLGRGNPEDITPILFDRGTIGFS